MKLNMFYLPPCIRAAEYSEVVSLQLHVFADASDLSYGVTVYERLINLHGIVHCALLLSRARVNPLKKMTIPRLELTAATRVNPLKKMAIPRLELQGSTH